MNVLTVATAFSGASPLVIATKNNDYSKVKILLSSNDVNKPDSRSYNALHWVATRGYIEITKVLLEHGANVNKS